MKFIGSHKVTQATGATATATVIEWPAATPLKEFWAIQTNIKMLYNFRFRCKRREDVANENLLKCPDEIQFNLAFIFHCPTTISQFLTSHKNDDVA